MWIEMVTLCDLAGHPESPWLHQASSKTKLENRGILGHPLYWNVETF